MRSLPEAAVGRRDERRQEGEPHVGVWAECHNLMEGLVSGVILHGQLSWLGVCLVCRKAPD